MGDYVRERLVAPVNQSLKEADEVPEQYSAQSSEEADKHTEALWKKSTGMVKYPGQRLSLVLVLGSWYGIHRLCQSLVLPSPRFSGIKVPTAARSASFSRLCLASRHSNAIARLREISDLPRGQLQQIDRL
jgi:hypothetical protein